MHRKKIPYYKVGGGRLAYFKKSEVEAFLTRCRVATYEEAEEAATAYIAAKPTKKGGSK